MSSKDPDYYKKQQEREQKSGNFTVGEILEERFEKGCHSYLVKWKFFPVEEASWEPANNVASCDAVETWKANIRAATVAQDTVRRKISKAAFGSRGASNVEQQMTLSSSEDDSRSAASSQEHSNTESISSDLSAKRILCLKAQRKEKKKTPKGKLSTAEDVAPGLSVSLPATFTPKLMMTDKLGEGSKKKGHREDAAECPLKIGVTVEKISDTRPEAALQSSCQSQLSLSYISNLPSTAVSEESLNTVVDTSTLQSETTLKTICCSQIVLKNTDMLKKVTPPKRLPSSPSLHPTPRLPSKPLVAKKVIMKGSPGTLSPAKRASEPERVIFGTKKTHSIFTQTEFDDPLTRIIPHELMKYSDKIEELRKCADRAIGIKGIVTPLSSKGEPCTADDMMVIVLCRNVFGTGEEILMFEKKVVKFVLPLLLIKFYENYLDLTLSSDVDNPITWGR